MIFDFLHLVALVVTLLVFLYKSYRLYRNEFKLYAPGIMIYTIFLFLDRISKILLTRGYLEEESKLYPDVKNDVYKSVICIVVILNPLRVFVPLSLVLFKRSEDIFIAFSKIENSMQVSKFQIVLKIKAGNISN